MAPLISRPLAEAWNWLCRAHAVEFCFLYLSFTNCFFAATGQSPEAYEFVSEKEMAVKKIAEAAVENWKSISQSDCSDQAARDRLKESCASGCSTNECQVPQRDIQSLSCVPFDNSMGLTGCSSKDGTRCNSIQANYDRGFVSFPDSARPREIPGEVDFSICGQSKLDATFKALLKPNGSEYFFNFYFASVDGSMRTYPGRQAQNCTQAPSQKPYDPRKRPWYKGAISIVHELVILLDCGSSMDNKVDLTRYGTRLQYARNLTLEVLETLSTGSSVNIITFDQSSTAARDGFLPATSEDEETISKDLEFQKLAQFVNSTAAAGGKSNITSGLALALNMFSSSVGEADNPLKIIMLLTDGTSDTSSAASMDFVRTQLKKNNIKLFLYQIGTNESTPVTSLACDVGGHKEVIVVQGNELYHVRSYFSLLAHAHAASNLTENGTKLAYWQGVYRDRGILGDVITVSYPAMSDDELIGVAAIDIQMGGFKLGDDIATLLGGPLKLFHYRPGSGDALQCQSIPPPALACSGAGLGAVCGVSIALPAADIRENHQCCKPCRGGSKKSKVTIIVASASAVAGVVGLLVFTFLVRRAAKRCRDGTLLIRSPPRANGHKQ